MERKRKSPVTENSLAVDTLELAGILHCGRTTAVKIGTAAGARLQIGKRVLWNLSKVRMHVDEISM